MAEDQHCTEPRPPDPTAETQLGRAEGGVRGTGADNHRQAHCDTGRGLSCPDCLGAEEAL